MHILGAIVYQIIYTTYNVEEFCITDNGVVSISKKQATWMDHMTTRLNDPCALGSQKTTTYGAHIFPFIYAGMHGHNKIISIGGIKM